MASDFPTAEIERLQRLIANGSPLPWLFNSYSSIRSLPKSNAVTAFCRSLPPDAPEEAYKDAPPDSLVCHVPVVSGDTATEQGYKDARLLVAAVNAIPALLSAISELRAERDRLRAFVRSFLNPSERGYAVSPTVRDEVRQFLGRKRVETRQQGRNQSDE